MPGNREPQAQTSAAGASRNLTPPALNRQHVNGHEQNSGTAELERGGGSEAGGTLPESLGSFLRFDTSPVPPCAGFDSPENSLRGGRVRAKESGKPVAVIRKVITAYQAP